MKNAVSSAYGIYIERLYFYILSRIPPRGNRERRPG
ncbi:MAG: hypothetical protein BWZ01_00453 [Deltaproteobacteria bacterium ADurb.BinA179]|jgi:hypothetical protein|nr:MAG: hypothetical protein BWZ01_00453 [Deltaproteobacteria bacterium ADurb.BinA179]